MSNWAIYENKANSKPIKPNFPAPQTAKFAQFNNNELRTMNKEPIKTQIQLLLRSLRPSTIKTQTNQIKLKIDNFFLLFFHFSLFFSPLRPALLFFSVLSNLLIDIIRICLLNSRTMGVWAANYKVKDDLYRGIT
jgi:hypothetical protein